VGDIVGLVCRLVVQPIVRLIQIVVSVIELILVWICRVIQEFVNILTRVLKYICNTVVRTVCNGVCSVVCGICDFIGGIFGCDCGCRNVCKNVCNAITDVVCGWTYVLEWVLQFITTVICDYIVRSILVLLHLIETIVTLVLTWVCSLIDIIIRWFLCWTYLAEIFNNRKSRRFRVAPKIIRNDQGYSDWFVYVNNADEAGNVDQNVQGYILSDLGRPLAAVVDSQSGEIGYFEMATRRDVITGRLKRTGKGEELVPGQPFLYYPFKVMEIASHLFGDIFAGTPADDGRGTAPENNLLTYNPNVQAWLDSDGTLATNNYNAWTGKYTTASSPNYFGDRSISDMGLRVDTDATCSRPTNTFLTLIRGDIGFTSGNTDLAENMTCGASQTLTFDQTNFLMLNKDDDASAVTTYFVSKYNANDSSLGCNDLLGYTVVTFEGSDQPLFINMRVLPFAADTNRMMARIVENISAKGPAVVRVAETYLHECSHQCGLLHDEDAPDCENDTTLHISKLMNPSGSVRRALTRFQWCVIRTSWYVTRGDVPAFIQATELPDSESIPPPPVP
jgi:hypothetical protein